MRRIENSCPGECRSKWAHSREKKPVTAGTQSSSTGMIPPQREGLLGKRKGEWECRSQPEGLSITGGRGPAVRHQNKSPRTERKQVAQLQQKSKDEGSRDRRRKKPRTHQRDSIERGERERGGISEGKATAKKRSPLAKNHRQHRIRWVPHHTNREK